MQADREEWVSGPIQCGGVQLSLWGDFALLNLKFPEGTSRRRAVQPSLASESTTKPAVSCTWQTLGWTSALTSPGGQGVCREFTHEV